MAVNIDSFEQLPTRIGRLRMRRCGSTSALTIFVVYAPTLSNEEEEVAAFHMDLEKFYREEHTFYKVTIGDFSAKIGPKERLEDITSEPTAFNGMSRERGFPCSSWRVRPYMGTRNSRSSLLYAGRGSHPMEDIIMKLTTSSLVKGFA
ncbi:hypothetical protein RB195_021886 [Necator americanus]|uniref:Inhibitor I9 domain-containing protein n=1 Tax=Necator americanus TaxID=51031 RepID=A0ABR1EE27_NECAM